MQYKMILSTGKNQKFLTQKGYNLQNQQIKYFIVSKKKIFL